MIVKHVIRDKIDGQRDRVDVINNNRDEVIDIRPYFLTELHCVLSIHRCVQLGSRSAVH